MKFSVFVSILLLLLYISLTAQVSETLESEFLPEGLHFQPLKAHVKEPRMGVLYFPENGQLKLDIGNATDLLQFQYGDKKLTFGIEFNAFAHSENYQGNRLQIDAIDGFFGGNAVFSSNSERTAFYTRLRIIHNSSHFVDGHFDPTAKTWKNDQEPIPFTRDFGELLFAYEKRFTRSSFKIYAGPTYATLVRPAEIKKWSFDSGFEYSLTNLFGTLFRKDENIFLGYHFELFGTPDYQGNNNIILGIKMGKWTGKGISLYLDYYSGRNLFNEYYKMSMKKFGIGFSVDFP